MAANGDVYVADSTNSRIQVFDGEGTFKRMWGKDVLTGGTTDWELCDTAANCKGGLPGGLGGEMDFPANVAFDPSGLVYVVENGNMRVQVFDSQGNFQRLWGRDAVSGGVTTYEICTVASQCQAPSPPYGFLGGEFYGPNGIAVGGGSVYVGDEANERLQKFDLLGNFQQLWGGDVVTGGATGYEICTVAADCKAGNNDGLAGELDSANGIAVSASGEVYVSDTNQRIQVFDTQGTFKRMWGKDVIPGGSTGFEICTSGPSCATGWDGALGGELYRPSGLALTQAGALYVADSENNRVQKFAADPPTTSPPAPTPAAAPKKCKKKKKKKKPRATAKGCKKKKKKKR